MNTCQSRDESRKRASEARESSPDGDVADTGQRELESNRDGKGGATRPARWTKGGGGIGNGTHASPFVNVEAGQRGRVGSDRSALGPHEVRRLAKLESQHGAHQVQRWVDEGMTVRTMGKPREMQAFRARQAARPEEVPQDIERQNEASRLRNTDADRDDGSAGEMSVPDEVREVVSSPGVSLDDDVQREMEAKLGGTFGDVQVHTGPAAAAAADSIAARAFTVGNHVVFNHKEYAPDTDEGKQVLAHELTHVIQQNTGSVRLLPLADGPLAIDDDPALEREADLMADRAGAESDESEEREDADDLDSDDADEPAGAGPSISKDEAVPLIADALRDRGIRAPAGMSMEDEYLYTADSSDSIFLFTTAENIPIPPAEWIIENVPEEGVADGAHNALTFKILVATDDEYWIQVAQTDMNTGKMEFARGGYADRFDGEHISTQITELLTDLEGDGVRIDVPTEDVWMPSETDDDEADEADEPDGSKHDEEADEDDDDESDSADKTYTIQDGDTLWDIAEAHDVAGGWQRLWTYNDNNEVIGDDPDLIHPGDTITIPIDSVDDDIDEDAETDEDT